MKHWMVRSGLALLSLTVTLAAAQGKDDREEISKLVRLSSQIAAELTKQRLLALGSECPVDAEEPPACPIAMLVFDVENPDYPQDPRKTLPVCLARAPAVKVNRESGKAKFINWELVPKELRGGPLAFHASSGIIITSESKPPQIDKNNRGLGLSGGPAFSHRYHIKTLSSAAKGGAAYLPLILWDRLDNGEVELCAGIDPKIVND